MLFLFYYECGDTLSFETAASVGPIVISSVIQSEHHDLTKRRKCRAGSNKRAS